MSGENYDELAAQLEEIGAAQSPAPTVTVRMSVSELRLVIDALRAAQQAKVPDDVARDAARYRWFRNNGRELYGDEVISLLERGGAFMDSHVDALLSAQSAQEGEP